FMYPHELEDRYVAKVISEFNDIAYDGQPHLLEDYLRNRFRNYMSRFRLYTSDHHKLSLKIELQANAISITPQNYNESDSKMGKCQGGALNLKQAELAPKQPNLDKLGDAGDFKFSGCPTQVP